MKAGKAHAEGNLFAMAGGLLLTFLFYKIILPKLSHISIIVRLFLPKGGWYQKGVPIAITLLFFWSLTDIIIKLLRIFKEKIILKGKLIKEIEKNKESIEKLSAKFKNAKGVVQRRIYSILNEILLGKQIQDIRDFLKYQSEIDADIAASQYTALRVFIWAMPILGFIGTVIGISAAVGNFSTFLTGDIENIDLVKRELSKIATGLSFAFDTTLLGLVASLIIMLLTSFAQNREERVLTDLDELCLNLTGELVPLISEKEDPKADLVRESLETFKQGIDSLKQFSQIILEKFSNAQNELQIQTKQLETVISNFTNSIESLRSISLSNLETLRKSKEEVVSDFKYIKESLENFKQSIDAFNQVSQTLLGRFDNVQSGLQNQINQLETSATALAKATDSLHSISNANSEILKNIESLGQNLESLNKNVSYNLIPLLNSISGPLELRLVPIQSNPIKPPKEGGEKDA